jgi:hypothetical protein
VQRSGGQGLDDLTRRKGRRIRRRDDGFGDDGGAVTVARGTAAATTADGRAPTTAVATERATTAVDGREAKRAGRGLDGQLYIESHRSRLPADCIDGGVTLHVVGATCEGTGGFVTLLAGDDKVHLDLVGTVSGEAMSARSTAARRSTRSTRPGPPTSPTRRYCGGVQKTSWFAYDGTFSLTRMDE